jgi:ethanolamine ammonia-lyase large subunit
MFLSGVAAASIRSSMAEVAPLDDLIGHVTRLSGRWDQRLFTQLLGHANAFKEGDELVGVAAPNEAARQAARELLGRTRLRDIDSHPPFSDGLSAALAADLDPAARERTAEWTVGELAAFLLTRPEADIKAIMPGLSSDVIACVVRMMDDEQLVRVGDTIFNPLPGTRIGSRGCLAARLQPNSPTDNPVDIRWQVFDGWAYGVGDVVLGTNPVSSEPESVKAVSDTLRGVLEAFGLADTMPHCVLSHIDIQAEVDAAAPGTTGVWFQSIAGSDAANATFDLTLDKMLRHADARRGPWGLYFETGQGADFTNGHAQGVDMVVHESRKYGFARLLAHRAARARGAEPWVHVNDGQTARTVHRPRRLWHAPHGCLARRPRLVSGTGAARPAGVSDGSPHQGRSDARLPDHGFSGPRAAPPPVWLPRRGADGAILPAARGPRHRGGPRAAFW